MHLDLQSVSKQYSEFALHPLTLKVEPGEFFCLLGPSGCGKTTVLRLIGGFESLDSGQILLGGTDISHQPPQLRNIHTVFQKYALFPHLCVFENVAFALRIQKRGSAEIKQRVTEALELLEIGPLSDRRTDQLSGGQAQRVALARALVDQPAVLLLDEPLSALDPSLRLRVREELKALCHKVGTTFIMVTHDQEEALQLSDRMAVMQHGHCLQVGTPKEIYEYPASAFVAQFIGPANVIQGDVQSAADSSQDYYVVHSASGKFSIPKNGAAPPHRISMILRPEKMRLLRAKVAQPNLIEGEVAHLTYLGSRTEYTIQTSKQIFKVFETEGERQKKKLLAPGSKVYLNWKAEDAILLPQGNEHEVGL